MARVQTQLTLLLTYDNRQKNPTSQMRSRVFLFLQVVKVKKSLLSRNISINYEEYQQFTQ